MNMPAVITVDPEDHYECMRLADILAAKGANRGRVANGQETKAVQAALREMADPTPPKPKEPTGLGAVVEDTDGAHWVRTDDVDCVTPWSLANNFTQAEYEDVKAVRVLSEGIS